MLVLVVVWVAVRAVGPTQASPALVVPAPAPSPSPSASVSASASPASPAARATPRRTKHSPAPSKPRPKPSRSASPSPRTPRTQSAATLQIYAAWNGGYAAGVHVTNTGSTPLTWRVTVTHADTVRPVGVHGATATRDGTTLVFRGGPLPPGATADFGYQATARGRAEARPTGCSVVGGVCGMR